jgi:anti-sigma factor RsiW
MNCQECRPLLQAYADGELDVLNSLRLEEHLSGCGGCEALIRQFKSIHLALQRPELSYAAPNALRQQISAAVPRRASTWRDRWNWSLPSFAMGGICVAAVVMLSAGNFVTGPSGSADEIVAAHVRSLMADHLTDVASSDSHTVKPWFTGKIDFTAPAKDLAADGFPLIGGRIDYIHDRAAAALVYKRNRHTINVFIWPDAAKDKPVKFSGPKRGFSIVEADANGLHFTAVSDLNKEELGQLVELIIQK